MVATADDGKTALSLRQTIDVDLILLDIEMPGMSGLALAERLAAPATMPAFVFVTAFEQFAVQAFAVDAIGYLLKPVDPDLLTATIDRVLRRAITLPSSIVETAAFWAPYRGTLVRLVDTDIDRITAEDDYARLHCKHRSFLVAERLYAIEQRLGQERFIRVHRSTLVNKDRITALELVSGSWYIRLSSGERFAVGRPFLPILRSRLGIKTGL